jgi:hypothetical protein
MAVYGAMGVRSGLSEMKNIGELVETMKMGKNHQLVFEGNPKPFKKYMPENPFDINMQKIGEMVEGVKKFQSFHSSKTMLALNINSFMAGATDIWKKAKDNGMISQEEQLTPATHSDGKIEVVCFSDPGALGMEKAFGKLDLGFAEKMVQGQGPFLFKFREFPDEKDHRTFFQIDGEFIKARHPKLAILRKSSLFPNSKIRVLRKLIK